MVILGLLTGGILAGQSLIRAAEMRAVLNEYQRYIAAVQSFRDKYMALPGDMTNATAFWGTMTNCGVASPSGSGTQTCNGDGDGNIEPPSAAARTGELFGFWRQLANAGLIEGSYSGIAGASDVYDSDIGVNIPASKISNAGWSTHALGTIDGTNTWYFAGTYGNFLGYGTSTSTSWTSNTVMSPEEMWGMDTKVDDGKPEVGSLRSRKDHAGTATTHCSSTATREYLLTNTGARCMMMFLQAF